MVYDITYKKIHIQFRLDGKEYANLQNILDKYGIGHITEADMVSDKMRSLLTVISMTNNSNIASEEPVEVPEPTGSKKTDKTAKTQKPVITNIKPFEGYVYCPQEDKMVEKSKCEQKCPEPLDREACTEMRAEMPKRTER